MEKISHIEYTNTGHDGDDFASVSIRIGWTGPIHNEIMFDLSQWFASADRPNENIHSNLTEEDASALIYALRKARHEIRKVNRAAEREAAEAADYENQYSQMLDEQQLAEDSML